MPPQMSRTPRVSSPSTPKGSSTSAFGHGSLSSPSPHRRHQASTLLARYDMHYYMCGPRSGHVRNSIALPCIFDFRWAFPSAAAARDFYDLISEEMTEEGNPPPAAKMRRLAGSLPGLPADADCLLLGDKDGNTGGAPPISFNAIFRVERVCAAPRGAH